MKEIKGKAFKFCLWIFMFYGIAGWLFYMMYTYPNAYWWTEILIKYSSAGYVRRGLLGTLLYLLPGNTVKFVWLGIDIVLITFFYIKIFKLLNDIYNEFVTYLIYFSPFYVGFLFRVLCPLGNKDLIFLIIFILIFEISLKIKNQKISTWLGFSVSIILFIFAVLIHEMSLFLCVLPLSFLLLQCGSFKKVNAYIPITLIVYAFLFVITISNTGTSEIKKQILKDWCKKGIVFSDSGAIGLLGTGSVKTSIKSLANNTTLISIIVACVFAILPLFYIFDLKKIYNEISKRASKFWINFCILAYIISAILLMMIIYDHGRVIAYNSILFILFVSYFIKSTNISKDTNDFVNPEIVSSFDSCTLTQTILMIIYFFLIHMVVCGEHTLTFVI